MFVVKKLTEYLPLLEDLKLWAGLDLGEAHHLDRFRFLNSLCWHYPLGYIDWGNSDEEDLNARIRQVFRNGARTPEVSIRCFKWKLDNEVTSLTPVDAAWFT
jgi:hypothetical protein